MIGEIKTVKLGREARALGRYICYSLWLIVPCLTVHLLHKLGGIDNHYSVATVSVLYWSIFFSAALLSLPFLRLTARTFAYCAMRYGSKLLYRSNTLYFAVAMHYDVALLAWSVFLLVAWRRVLLQYIDQSGGNGSNVADAVDNVLTSYVAFRVGWLVKDFAVLIIATKYLWRPYLERVQTNIFAQYVLLMLTDYVTKGYIDRDDERFALQISNKGMRWDRLSLYAVSKAIGFIPRHKLGHEFFKDLLESNDTQLDSAKEARVLGNFLFEQLIFIAAGKSQRGGSRFNRYGRYGSVTGGNGSGAGATLTPEDPLSRMAAGNFGATGNTMFSVVGTEDNSATLRPPTAASVFAGHYLTIGRNALGRSPLPTTSSRDSGGGGGSSTVGGGSGGASGGGCGGSSGSGSGIVPPIDPKERERDELAEVLTRVKHLDQETFCPHLDPLLAEKAFAMFDIDGNGEATREEMVQGVVHTFHDHKSLSLTLKDSQHIAVKLGQIIGAVILFVLLFVWLALWGFDVKALSITFASFLVAIAFMIGNAASNLFVSIIYVFVMRMYDVGDRVMIHDDRGKLQNCVVVKINLLLTEFKRWDDQTFYIPNAILSTRTAINVQRSGHQWHEFFIQVAAATTGERLGHLKARLQEFARANDNPQSLYGYMIFALVGIEDSTKLTVRICFRQKSNFQDLSRYWAQHSICTQAIKEACDDLAITYSLPELPIGLKQKLV
ncbi:unnamed protein product [Phaeothamnion confervicola]